MDKIGYRTAVILSHVFASSGLILMATLPFAMSNSYVGLMIGTIICSIGGGIAEVIISPVVEAIPEKTWETCRFCTLVIVSVIWQSC